jgi:hypothetical protein
MVCLVVLSASLALAQVTSTIQGHISDSTGASVPKALVKATNEQTGVSRTVYSADDGYYRIPDLLPGRYELRTELAGFKSVVKSGVEVASQSVEGLNFMLEVGEVTQTVTITGEEAQVETQQARISEVISETELKALPTQGRGILTLVAMSPGITGKMEGQGYFCCDVFSNFAAPRISAGGNELKANFTLDGLSLRYTEGSVWGSNFSPNPDAVTELRVSTNPYSPEFGTVSGPQVQMVTKGGTNNWHGTGHFTFNQDDLNAVPFGGRREDIPDSYTRLFGGTGGGPIIKDRLFVFGAYEGIREKATRSFIALTETEAFKDYVLQTRPDSVAAQLFRDYPPFRYPTSGFSDVDGDGIPELGEVNVDKPARRTGKQFNGRVDYQSASGSDRLFGSYWYTRPEWNPSNVRNDFDLRQYNRVDYAAAVHTHSFSPNALNEVRFGYTHMFYETIRVGDVYHVPELNTDDGFSMGNGGWSREYFPTTVPEFGDVFSLNRGRHGIKFGGAYRHSTVDLQSMIPCDTPQYLFASIIDFADDNPYSECRNLDVETGKSTISKLFFISNEVSLFFQNTWQIRPNLTLNYGVRWDNYFSNTLGNDRSNWQPVLSSEQLNPSAIATVINQKVDKYYNSDKNNFGPRIGVAWDPTAQGKLVIRANFGILYDEINTLPLYAAGTNPPGVAAVTAGIQQGIPVVYGLAPIGTRDFPANPNLPVPVLSPAGGFVGTRVGLGGNVTDLKAPMIFDSFGGVQYQLLSDLMVHASYRYRNTRDELYDFDANRFAGDLVDGLLDRMNPNFNSITMTSNLGQRRYHGIVAGVDKRFSQGWQLKASYTYNHGRNNFGSVNQSNFYSASATEAYNPSIDWARDDIAHVFTLHNVWQLPFLRNRSGWLAGAFGGWELNTIWNLQSGEFFIPISYGLFGEGGDFNADGQSGERPDSPTVSLPSSFSKDEWLAGPLTADMFPRPDTVRPGTLPRNFLRGPGYARIDAAFVKAFPIPIGRPEKARLQVRAEAFNLLNRINLTGLDTNLDSSNFGQATSAYGMRVLQMSIKFVF